MSSALLFPSPWWEMPPPVAEAVCRWIPDTHTLHIEVNGFVLNVCLDDHPRLLVVRQGEKEVWRGLVGVGRDYPNVSLYVPATEGPQPPWLIVTWPEWYMDRVEEGLRQRETP